MTEPLSVDTSRLQAAARALGDLDVPEPPQRLAVAGTDAMSVAINDTLPLVEAPVIGGLPIAESAVKRTASNMSEAAGMYEETDKSSAAHIARGRTVGAAPGTTAPAGAAARNAASTAPASAGPVSPATSPSEPTTGQPSTPTGKPSSGQQGAPQLSDIGPMVGPVTQSLSQELQGLMSKAQGVVRNPGTQPVPDAAQSAAVDLKDADASNEDSKDEDSKDEDEQQSPADGAASGRAQGPVVPIADAAPPATTPLPSTAQSGVE